MNKMSAMIGCLRTLVRKQPIIALYFESETELKFYYNLEIIAKLERTLETALNHPHIIHYWPFQGDSYAPLFSMSSYAFFFCVVLVPNVALCLF